MSCKGAGSGVSLAIEQLFESGSRRPCRAGLPSSTDATTPQPRMVAFPFALLRPAGAAVTTGR